jgi:hypothetical protein
VQAQVVVVADSSPCGLASGQWPAGHWPATEAEAVNFLRLRLRLRLRRAGLFTALPASYSNSVSQPTPSCHIGASPPVSSSNWLISGAVGSRRWAVCARSAPPTTTAAANRNAPPATGNGNFIRQPQPQPATATTTTKQVHLRNVNRVRGGL